MDNSKETDTNSEEIMQSAPAPSSVPAAPKNWANLVKGGPGLVFSASAPQPDITVAPQPQSFVAITQQQQQQAQQQQKVQSDNFATSDRRRNNNNERERRTSGSNYNNSSQDGNCSLFLGNLPTRATEDELRQMFSVFGKITELRIHNKSSQNRQVPNFGFIKFEDPASASKLQESTVSSCACQAAPTIVRTKNSNLFSAHFLPGLEGFERPKVERGTEDSQGPKSSASFSSWWTEHRSRTQR